MQEILSPTPGASGVSVLKTRFWPGDKLRYCIIEYWSCGNHDEGEYCSECRKRVVTFRYTKQATVKALDDMLEMALT